MSDFGPVALDCLRLRVFIPPEHVGAYDRITDLALRQSFAPDIDALEELVESDFRPLAPVIELHGNGAA